MDTLPDYIQSKYSKHAETQAISRRIQLPEIIIPREYEIFQNRDGIIEFIRPHGYKQLLFIVYNPKNNVVATVFIRNKK